MVRDGDEPLIAELADVEPSPAPVVVGDRLPEAGPWYGGTSTLRTAIATLTSVAFHSVAIIVLGLLVATVEKRAATAPLSVSVDEPKLQVEQVTSLPQAAPFDASAPVAATRASAGLTLMRLPQAQSIAPSAARTFASASLPTIRRSDVGVADLIMMTAGELALGLPYGARGDPLTTANDYNEVADTLTNEIRNRLVRDQVLVIWLFDQSLSMKDDQAEIAENIERIYATLNETAAAKKGLLQAAVASYGAGFLAHTKRPTANIDNARRLIQDVPVDESGEEMTCSAVIQAVQTFQRFVDVGPNRQIMIFLVTDESGNRIDNERMLEPAIAVCKQSKASVYVIGRESVFGFPHIQFVMDVAMKVEGVKYSRRFTVRADRGPETPLVETLQTSGFGAERRDALPSGFGSYELSRLTRETGGMLILLPTSEEQSLEYRRGDTVTSGRVENRDDTKFSLEHMRPYLPELSDRPTYIERRNYDPLRAAVGKVIGEFAPNPRDRPRTSFGNESHFDPAVAQIRSYFEKLQIAERSLRDVERWREQHESPRWRANYDLLLAQIISYKARAYAYAAFLNAAKVSLNWKYVEAFLQEPKNKGMVFGGWALSRKYGADSDVEMVYYEHDGEPLLGLEIAGPWVTEAKDRLKTIARTYSGTPWAARAEFELKRGYRFQLGPRFFTPPPPIPVVLPMPMAPAPVISSPRI